MLSSYQARWLQKDVIAGLVLTALLVPQGMAYAELSGLPAITGLYTSILCLVAYALFGRHHRTVGFATFGALILLGIATQSLNWFVWAGLLFFLVGFNHTPPLDDVTPLTAGRRVLGWVCLILLVLLIPPVPIAFS